MISEGLGWSVGILSIVRMVIVVAISTFLRWMLSSCNLRKDQLPCTRDRQMTDQTVRGLDLGLWAHQIGYILQGLFELFYAGFEGLDGCLFLLSVCPLRPTDLKSPLLQRS
jgi:hypothetical protein